jgi:hypothetical protein
MAPVATARRNYLQNAPSLTPLPSGGWEVAWKGGDGYLWLATGNGINITAKGNPWLLRIA